MLTTPPQRRLNGNQTTGRSYHDLSQPEHAMVSDLDVRVPMPDGTVLLADVHRPAEPGVYPVLVAASPYPRQIQDLGAPLGFVEAGQSDFFVPRGYVHLIANLRGTGGSGGTFGFFDAQERRDLHDLVEWAGTQWWSCGDVGMIGISYFAMAQLEAAVERPSHLRAIFPLAATADLFTAATHHGLVNSTFITPFLAMVGMAAGRSGGVWRSRLANAARHVLHEPHVHERLGGANGEAAVNGMKAVLRLHHDPHPWDDLWRAIVAEHPVRDAWWDERSLLPLLDRIEVPVYLGCDWDNVPLHLPSTFPLLHGLTGSPHVRAAMLGANGLNWPWESLHVEALAWFDQWLKGHDTGILDGDRVRYVVRGDDAWRTAATWPPPEATHEELALRSDAALGAPGDDAAGRALMTLGPGLGRARPSAADLPAQLAWDAAPVDDPFDIVGDGELRLRATSTAADTAWVAVLQDVAPDGATREITAGYLRASLRDGERTMTAVPVGEPVDYRIPLVATTWRLPTGHRLRLVLTSDDQVDGTPSVLGFRHASVGTSSVNTVLPGSVLRVPYVVAAADAVAEH